MGYNISDVSGNSSGGVNDWTFTADLAGPTASGVSGDFNVVDVFGGDDLGEATDGYTFGPLSTTDYGTLSFDTTTGAFTFTVDTAAVIASNTNQVVTFSVTGRSGADVDDDLVTINILICVARGTLVETDVGPVPVETLGPGDLVLTQDNGARPIRWIGSRKLTVSDLRTDPSLRPVRISAGALGGNRPFRDLRVSPQHRVVLSDWRAQLLFGEGEVLVPAKAMINDHSIMAEAGDRPVEYFHILFDEHEVILTDGVPTESFHPGPYALRELGDAAQVELHKLFPRLFETDGYGQAARMSLRPWEGRLIKDVTASETLTGAP